MEQKEQMKEQKEQMKEQKEQWLAMTMTMRRLTKKIEMVSFHVKTRHSCPRECYNFQRHSCDCGTPRHLNRLQPQDHLPRLQPKLRTAQPSPLLHSHVPLPRNRTQRLRQGHCRCLHQQTTEKKAAAGKPLSKVGQRTPFFFFYCQQEEKFSSLLSLDSLHWRHADASLLDHLVLIHLHLSLDPFLARLGNVAAFG